MEVASCPRLRIVIRRKDGAVIDKEVTYPKGHQHNPMTAANIDAKLDGPAATLKDSKREEIREAWWAWKRRPTSPTW